MAARLEIPRADLFFNAAFSRPEFAIFRENSSLLDCVYRRLEPNGLRLADMRFEGEPGSLGDRHLLLSLFDYMITVRLRADRVEVVCAELPRNIVEKFQGAIVNLLRALKDHGPDLAFQTFTVSVGLHCRPEGQSVADYLARFVTNAPTTLGPSTGSGVVFYQGADGDRLLSTLTIDVSTVVPDGMYVRIHGVWDAVRVALDVLPATIEAFVGQALAGLGLELPV